MSWHALDWTILWPALVAGLLVLLTHVPLGMDVLDRGIVFVDLAIAQVAGLGVILAHGMGIAEQGWGVQLAAVTSALVGAALLTWTERQAAQQHEAFIGVLFVLASSVGILALARNPHGGEHLQEVLSQLKSTPARMVLYSSYQDSRPSEWLGRNAGLPVVMVPFTVGGSDKAADLTGLFDDIVGRLLAAAAQK